MKSSGIPKKLFSVELSSSVYQALLGLARDTTRPIGDVLEAAVTAHYGLAKKENGSITATQNVEPLLPKPNTRERVEYMSGKLYGVQTSRPLMGNPEAHGMFMGYTTRGIGTRTFQRKDIEVINPDEMYEKAVTHPMLVALATMFKSHYAWSRVITMTGQPMLVMRPYLATLEVLGQMPVEAYRRGRNVNWANPRLTPHPNVSLFFNVNRTYLVDSVAGFFGAHVLRDATGEAPGEAVAALSQDSAGPDTTAGLDWLTAYREKDSDVFATNPAVRLFRFAHHMRAVSRLSPHLAKNYMMYDLEQWIGPPPNESQLREWCARNTNLAKKYADINTVNSDDSEDSDILSGGSDNEKNADTPQDNKSALVRARNVSIHRLLEKAARLPGDTDEKDIWETLDDRLNAVLKK